MGWHERLGFGADRVALIVHADDAGFSHDRNLAIAECHDQGVVTSASVVIDWPWAERFLTDYAPNMPDVGLHFVVSGLSIANRQEVEDELTRQFDKMAATRKPLHIDSHGGVVFMSEVSTLAYTGFSNLKAVPAMMCFSEEMACRYPDLAAAERYPFPILDDILMAPANLSLDDKLGWALNTLAGLRPGLYQWIVHPSAEGDGLTDSGVLKHHQLKRLLGRRRFVLTDWSDVWRRYVNS